MGTNYYWVRQVHEPCPHCGHQEPDQVLHIGKASVGWCFGLRVYPELDINTLVDWTNRWGQGLIRSEYGDVLSPNEMMAVITQRLGRSKQERLVDFDYAANHAEPGPNNLARHKIDGEFVIGHGPGTWDLIIGEFN